MKPTKSKTKTRKKAGRSASLRCDALVRLCLSLTQNEVEILTRIMGMSASDDGDEDATALQSIARKIQDTLPNVSDQTRAED